MPRSQRRTARGRVAVGGTAVDALGDAGQLRRGCPAAIDSGRPSVERHGRRQHHVIVDEGEALFLALDRASTKYGRGARQAAGGIVAQQVRAGCATASAVRGGAPVARSRAQRSAGVSPGATKPAGFDLRADLGDVLAGIEIDAEGAAIAFEEEMRARPERDEAAGADAVRRHRRGEVLERAGVRARRRRTDRDRATG